MITLLKKLLLLFILVQWCSSERLHPDVVTKSGKIVGRYLTSFKGNKYEAYQGIPFALPPIGDRRFKSPEPVEPWSEELLANRMRDNCIQNFRSVIKGSEDCLYLNVFVPTKNRNTSLPTIFWIHGGGFFSGGNEEGQEEYLMDYDVIFVTIQHRLGILGFLSTEDHVVSGNMGLKDQSMALKWVHDNIEFFGGDPNRIMLLGHSSGAACVHLHYLSPWSAGLFQTGISVSGTAFHPWARTRGSPRAKAFEVGRMMNCSTSDAEEMIRCLRSHSAEGITRTLSEFPSWSSNPDIFFSPVIEISTSDWFVNDSAIEMIKNGKAYDVPWITSIVSEEGLLIMADSTDDKSMQEINDNWNNLAPIILNYTATPKEDQANISKIIRDHYFGEKPINKETFKTLIHLVGDKLFEVDAEKAARAQAEANKSPVWFYKYSYRATDSRLSRFTNKTSNYGVVHGEDIYLVIKNKYITPLKSDNDMLMQRKLIQLLTSFAYHGVPNLDVEWPAVDPSESAFRYLNIDGPEKMAAEMSDNFGEKKFWDSINLSHINV